MQLPSRPPPLLRTLALLALAACTEPSDLGEDEAAIVNGVVTSIAGTGFVEVDSCGGIALTHEWVLTTASCVYDPPDQRPHFVTLGTWWIIADEVVRHPTRDVALVHVPEPLPLGVPAATTGVDRGLYRGTTASLVGRVAQCMGYGVSNIAGTDSGFGYGVLRAAALTFDRLEGDELVILPNPSNDRIFARGDGGSGCLVHDGAGQQVVAALHTHNRQRTVDGWDIIEIFDSRALATSDVREWVSEVTMMRELRLNGRCLAAGSSSVGLSTCDGSRSQRWRWRSTGDHAGAWQNAARRTCLQLSATGVIEMALCETAPPISQRFTVESYGTGNRLVAQRTGQCLKWDYNNAFAILVGSCDVRSLATLTSIPDRGHRTLAVGVNGDCADIPSGTATAGTRANHYPCNDSAAQEWNLVARATAGDFELRPRGDGALCLRATPTAITQQPCDGGASQRWRLRPLTGGGYQLVTDDDHCLTSTASAQSPGLFTNFCRVTSDQTWSLQWH